MHFSRLSTNPGVRRTIYWAPDTPPRPQYLVFRLVGASGIEPPTTCVSSKCSTAELRACRCGLMPAIGLL